MIITKRIFYGWVVVLASIVLTALGLGMFTSTNSVFVVPICSSLGFARGQFTMYRTIITLVGALVMPLYGKLIQRVGVKKVLLAGAVGLGLVAIGYSFATDLWHFYALAVINGLFLNGVSFMSVGVLVSAWFDGKKGLATGLAYSGSGLGGAIMVPIVGRIIEWMSWQWAYRIMGVIGLAILIPVIMMFVRNKPEEMGLLPLAPDASERKSAQEVTVNLTLREALHTGKFWIMIGVFFLINLFAGATNTHSAPYLTDLGHQVTFVSAVISLFMLFLTIGKIILGLVYDRLGALTGNMMVSFFALGFPVFALLANQPGMPWVYAVFIGMASCGVSVPVSILAIRYFGDKDFPAIFGFCSMVSTLAPSISVPAMGAVYDVTGSYRIAWIVFLVCSVFIAAGLMAVEWMHRKELRTRNVT